MQEEWFDAHTGVLRLDEIVAQRPTFQKIMADNIVTAAEFREQSATVADLMRQLEAMLSPDAKAAATNAFAELAVLLALSAKAQTGG